MEVVTGLLTLSTADNFVWFKDKMAKLRDRQDSLRLRQNIEHVMRYFNALTLSLILENFGCIMKI